MSTATSLIVTNRSKQILRLILEPWAEEYEIPAGMVVEISAHAHPEKQIEVGYDGENIIVYGWADDMSVRSNGEILKPSFNEP